MNAVLPSCGNRRPAYGIVQASEHCDRKHQEHGRCCNARRVPTLPQRPDRVSNAVDQLDQRPTSGNARSGSPASPYRNQVTPETERHQSNVDHQEAELTIPRNETGQEGGRREGLPETSEIFLRGMGGLSENQKAEGTGEALGHRAGQCSGQRAESRPLVPAPPVTRLSPAHGHCRIDLRGPARRQPAGSDADSRHRHRHPGDRDWIVRRHAEQQALDQAGGGK